MLGRWAVLLALAITSFAAPSPSSDVTFHPALPLGDIRQQERSGALRHYVINPSPGAFLRSITAASNSSIGTLMHFVPTTSAFMNTGDNTDPNIVLGLPSNPDLLNQYTNIDELGHIVLGSRPDEWHLTANAALLHGEYTVTPTAERGNIRDDENQVDQFWSLERSTGILTFLGAPFVKAEPPVLTGFAPQPSLKPEDRVRLIAIDKTTSLMCMKMQG